MIVVAGDGAEADDRFLGVCSNLGGLLLVLTGYAVGQAVGEGRSEAAESLGVAAAAAAVEIVRNACMLAG